MTGKNNYFNFQNQRFFRDLKEEINLKFYFIEINIKTCIWKQKQNTGETSKRLFGPISWTIICSNSVVLQWKIFSSPLMGQEHSHFPGKLSYFKFSLNKDVLFWKYNLNYIWIYRIIDCIIQISFYFIL